VLCGVISFLSLNLKAIIFMKTTEDKAKDYLKNVVGTISKHASECVIIDFTKGYETCQKEYEEKLRWIPVEEKDAPTEIVQMKLENGEIRFGFFQDRFKTTSNVNGFDFIKVTHYRTLSFYNAT
jgi:hypothetical protein